MLVRPLSSGRKISNLVYLFKRVNLVGENLFFQNPLIFNGVQVIDPSQEFVASLGSNDTRDFKPPLVGFTKSYDYPVFYFIYNFDNYLHFVYDCLPYLIEYRKLKKTIPELKLLVNYPNPSRKEFYKFNIEFLELLGILNNDLVFVSSDTLYQELYVSETLTYCEPPKQEAFSVYSELVENAKKQVKLNTPEKFYISRRTHLNNQGKSNRGTDYTTRRKLVNEDELVEFLTGKGYQEVFTENLSTVEKILYFNQAKSIVGALGGGLVNCLFSTKNTKVAGIASPHIMEVNKRLNICYSFANTTFFDGTFNIENGPWKKHVRVKTKDGIVGEIKEISKDSLTIEYSPQKVSGWNREVKFDKLEVYKHDCVPLDKGINSSWAINMKTFKSYFNGIPSYFHKDGQYN